MAWTDERAAEAKRLYQVEGKSAAQVAKQLGGVTRNAVIAKLHRMGVLGGGGRQQPGAPSRPMKAPTVKRNRHAANGVNAGRALSAQVMVDRPPEAPPLPKLKGGEVPCTPRPWTERRFGECTYPMGGEGADLLSCCNAAPDGKYCADHARICYQPQTGKKGGYKPAGGSAALRTGRAA